VLGITAAVFLLYVAVLGAFVSQANQRLADLGGVVIVICGAVCLNAVTVSTATERIQRTENRYRAD
jgi:hypothetical protein